MNADELIEQVRGLTEPSDLDRVGKAVEAHRAELLADNEAGRRIAELQSGAVEPMSHTQVFDFVRHRIREA